MSNDIKVGDVCEITFPRPLGQWTSTYNNTECTVRYLEVKQSIFGVMHQCELCDGNIANVAAMFLRKKPPKADDSQWIRQETVPREAFDRWLERARQIKPRIEEPA